MIVEAEALGSRFLKLLRDGVERDRLSRLGLERAREYGGDRVASLYESVYADLLVGREGVPSGEAHL